MGSISSVYHALFDLTGFLGVKFRYGDWVLALTAPFVLLHFVFRSKYSQFKSVANFWALYGSYFLAHFFQSNVYIYAAILATYALLLIYFKDRHFHKIPWKYLALTLFFMSSGVSLFIISDYYMYWLLHTYWHYAAFIGMYWIIKIGSSPQDALPISQRIICHSPEESIEPGMQNWVSESDLGCSQFIRSPSGNLY